MSVQCCVCTCVPRAGLCTCEGRGAALRGVGVGRRASTRTGPPRVKRRPAAGSSPPRPRGRADALTRPTAPWAHRRVPGGRSDQRPADAQRAPQAVPRTEAAGPSGEPGALGCPDAGSTLPAAAPRPRSGHARPVPKEEARYRCGRAGGGVGTTRQTRGSPADMSICLVPGLLTQGRNRELSSNLDLGSTTGRELEVGLTGPSLPAVSQG